MLEKDTVHSRIGQPLCQNRKLLVLEAQSTDIRRARTGRHPRSIGELEQEVTLLIWARTGHPTIMKGWKKASLY